MNYNDSQDTIAAIATGLTNSGVGIIRISGYKAIEIANNVFLNRNNEKALVTYNSHTIHYGYIVFNGITIDEVLVSVMKAPNTFTREDVVEINCHGGIVVMKKVLDSILANGARLALPGEFTKRAFLNGRIDLSQAEAVIEIINSKNDLALKSSVSQLKGNVSKKVILLREEIIDKVSYIEAALDDPEHLSLDNYSETIRCDIEKYIDEINELISSYDNGRLIVEGIKTVILGKPNAGKSSFLNRILGEDRAIVTDVAGTTRDTLQEVVNIDGITLNIIDTAGIHETEDKVEKIGVKKAIDESKTADLIIFIADASKELDDDDLKILSFIENKKVIVLLNKTDLRICTDVEKLKKHTKHDIIQISALTGEGMNIFVGMVKEMFYNNKIFTNDEICITNIRHKECLEKALDSLNSVKETINMGVSEDFLTIDMLNAYQYLGEIIGETMNDDLANNIFSKFCMGK